MFVFSTDSHFFFFPQQEDVGLFCIFFLFSFFPRRKSREDDQQKPLFQCMLPCVPFVPNFIPAWGRREEH